MPLTENQTKALKAKLRYRHVKTRDQAGARVSYVEGWHVIAEANRIFGFDSWDRQTLSPKCQWTRERHGETVCFYSAKVRITVRAGGTITIREGMGTGLGRSRQAEVAHEMALKTAETDATKRALATFGNPFGLALYEREKSHVTKPRPSGRTMRQAPDECRYLFNAPDGGTASYETPEAFVDALSTALADASSLETAFGLWAVNVETVAMLKQSGNGKADERVAKLVSTLRSRVLELARIKDEEAKDKPADPQKQGDARGGQAETLFRAKEKRRRNKPHLAFVARQPCLVCGRRPSQAHHVRFAQPKALGLKVSDEYTVPLCNAHHDELHRTGDERAWWARHGIIEPLKHASRLWAASRRLDPEDNSLPDAHEAPSAPGANAQRHTNGFEPDP